MTDARSSGAENGDDRTETAEADRSTGEPSDDRGDGERNGGVNAAMERDRGESDDPEQKSSLRARVEAEYDFDEFGPEEMARMTLEEWEAAFDPSTWITGPTLLDRVEADLRHRVSVRDVFAVIERLDDEDGPRLLAYSDEGYAIVYPDGSVEGEGTVRRDVEPSVALCSMEEYEPPEPPADGGVLPSPEAVPEGSGALGNLMLQLIAGMLVLSGVAMIGASVFGVTDAPAITFVVGLAFLGASLLLLLIVVNARLSDRFRAEEYRNRLRSVGVDTDDRPAFVPEGSVVGTNDTDDEHEVESGSSGGRSDKS